MSIFPWTKVRLRWLGAGLAGLLLTSAPLAAADHSVDVRDFGAKGDGTTLCTGPIQKAIDQCATRGGGTVYFPPGVFRSGTIMLRFAQVRGALIRGSALADPIETFLQVEGAQSRDVFLTANDLRRAKQAVRRSPGVPPEALVPDALGERGEKP